MMQTETCRFIRTENFRRKSYGWLTEWTNGHSFARSEIFHELARPCIVWRGVHILSISCADEDLPSISYVCESAAKFWYIVPHSYHHGFERAIAIYVLFAEYVNQHMGVCDKLLREIHNFWPQVPVRTNMSCKSVTCRTAKSTFCSPYNLCTMQESAVDSTLQRNQFWWFLIGWCR